MPIHHDEAKNCLDDIRRLIDGMVLDETHQRPRVATDNDDIIIEGMREPSDNRENWWEYWFTIFLEGGDVPARALFGSMISICDDTATWQVPVELVVEDKRILHASVMLPDPAVKVRLSKGMAYGNTIFVDERRRAS